jgi:TfoX/Sxy family transcriptional regulator of competence genes
MAFSAALADRVRHSLARQRGVVEKKMFGGVGFLLNGNLLVGVWKDSLIARLDAEDGKAALGEPHVGPFTPAGRPMAGWVLVEPEGIDTDDLLAGWVRRALTFVRTLSAK